MTQNVIAFRGASDRQGKHGKTAEARARALVGRERALDSARHREAMPLGPLLAALSKDMEMDVALLEAGGDPWDVQQHLAYYAAKLSDIGEQLS